MPHTGNRTHTHTVRLPRALHDDDGGAVLCNAFDVKPAVFTRVQRKCFVSLSIRTSKWKGGRVPRLCAHCVIIAIANYGQLRRCARVALVTLADVKFYAAFYACREATR